LADLTAKSLLVAAMMRTFVLMACGRRPSYIPLLQHAQKPRLRLHRHIANLIEEKGASSAARSAAER